MRSLKLDVDAALAKLVRKRPRRSAVPDSPSQPDSIAKARLPGIDGEAVEADSGSFCDERDNFGRTDNDVDQTSAAEKLDGLLGGMIRPCGRLYDVPSRWTPQVQREIELELPKNASRIEKFISALRALVKDMRRRNAGMRTITLQQGEAIELDGSEHGYRFPYDGDADLFEGAKVSIVIGTRTSEGRIVSVGTGSLIISLDDDLGPFISACVLRIDNTAMIDALADRLGKVKSGESRINLSIADDVLDNSEVFSSSRYSPTDHMDSSSLNAEQKEAVHHILAETITYIWGPPGTGKTHTLGFINQLLFAAGKRILICSNTNQAVNQVLKKLCETFGLKHQGLVDGKILRIGTSDGIPQQFHEYVTLDGIVRRKSHDLQHRKTQLLLKMETYRGKAESAKALVERFALLDRLTEEYAALSSKRLDLEKSLSSLLTENDGIQSLLSKLEIELHNRTQAGSIRRLLMRSEDTIKADIARQISDKNRLDERLEEQRGLLDAFEFTNRLTEMLTRKEILEGELHGFDRSAVATIVDAAEREVVERLREITSINSQLDGIARSVASGAQIIGATVTKTFLSPQQFGSFDVVIIDEASMVILPALYYVCGLAKERVIISGDFRQLSPIVPTEEQAITEVIGFDVFRSAGISASASGNEIPKRTVMLKEQRRMCEPICRLISNRMYYGKLKTIACEVVPHKSLPAPFDGEMTIVDTSSIQPFVTKFGSSRYNLMNALAVRNLVRFLRKDGFIGESSDQTMADVPLGVCTPFAAQKELLKRLLVGSGALAGTVHRYQGDEKLAMVIDIPDSLGERYVSMFAQASSPEEAGAQLFNVAVSRAKSHLIFIANLDYLDRKLPEDAFLREILHAASSRGRVIDVREVISLWPITDDLRQYGTEFTLDPGTLATGLFDQTNFDLVFKADVDRAKKGVAIFSGFVTPQRVGAYDALFRRKVLDGISIRCVTRPPARNGSIPLDQGKDALQGLEAMGCVVDTRWDIHQKVVIIDDEIVWFGSLNPLSHTCRTDEMMARIASKPAALQMAAFLSITSKVSPDKAEGLAFCGENPRCGDCSGRTTYRVGTRGPYWQCEEQCGWTESVGRAARKGVGGVGERSSNGGPPCPKCQSKTILRSGPYGQFFGCSKFPICNGLIKADRPAGRRASRPVSKRGAEA